MTHNTTVTPEQFKLLQGRQRHLIVKHDPLFMPEDTLLVSEPDSRQQLRFTIVSCSQENINQKGSLSLLGLYAPYGTEDDLPVSVGGGYKNLSQEGEQC